MSRNVFQYFSVRKVEVEANWTGPFGRQEAPESDKYFAQVGYGSRVAFRSCFAHCTLGGRPCMSCVHYAFILFIVKANFYI